MVGLITYYPTGQKYIVEERVDGKRQYEVFIYNAAGRIINKLFYTGDGQLTAMKFMQNGQLHNAHGPTQIQWYHNGQIFYIKYAQNGLRHNLYGPAEMYWVNGKSYEMTYWQNGLRHKLYGPAWMLWDDTGKIYRIDYWQNNNLVKHIIV